MHPNLTCCICLDDMTNDTAIVALPCGHCFGEQCIEDCLLSGVRRCPLCQKSFRASQTIQVYLPLEEDYEQGYKQKYDELAKKTNDLANHYQVLKDLCDMAASNAPIINRVNDLVNQLATTQEELKGKAILDQELNQAVNPAPELKRKKTGKLCKLFAGMKL